MANPKGNEIRPLWTADDVAAYLGWHPQTVYRKARAGEIPSVKVGRALRFRPEEIEALPTESRPDAA